MSKQSVGEPSDAELNSGSCSVQRLLGFVWFCLQSLWLFFMTPLAAAVWIFSLLWENLPNLIKEVRRIYANWLTNARKEWRKFYSPNGQVTESRP